MLLRLWILVLWLHVTTSTTTMYTFSRRRGRSSLARTIFNRMQEDEHHRTNNHSYWYQVDTSRLPADLCDKFVEMHKDDETRHFLDKCYEKADWVFTQIYHSVAKSILSWFMETTSINGWLGRGSMFVFSRAQLTQLLGIPEGWKRENLLDLGAGDGEVTMMMAPYFTNVYATETSAPMVNRLNNKGFRILDITEWDNGIVSFDLIGCLNLLDRCDKPISILRSMKKSLSPGGLVLIAVVLPFKPFVEFGSKDNTPTENITLNGHSFEDHVSSFVMDVLEPAGFSLVKFTRLPYLCEGGMDTSFYVLDDAVFVVRVKDGS